MEVARTVGGYFVGVSGCPERTWSPTEPPGRPSYASGIEWTSTAYGVKLDERHQQRERDRATQASQQVTARQTPRERRRAQRGDWINRNAGPNTPQWLKDANKAVWDGVLIYGVGSIAVVVLLILFIIGLNMS